MVLRTRDGKCILCNLNLGESIHLKNYLGITKVLGFNFLGRGGGSLVLSGLLIMVPNVNIP